MSALVQFNTYACIVKDASLNFRSYKLPSSPVGDVVNCDLIFFKVKDLNCKVHAWLSRKQQQLGETLLSHLILAHSEGHGQCYVDSESIFVGNGDRQHKHDYYCHSLGCHIHAFDGYI